MSLPPIRSALNEAPIASISGSNTEISITGVIHGVTVH